MYSIQGVGRASRSAGSWLSHSSWLASRRRVAHLRRIETTAPLGSEREPTQAMRGMDVNGRRGTGSKARRTTAAILERRQRARAKR